MHIPSINQFECWKGCPDGSDELDWSRAIISCLLFSVKSFFHKVERGAGLKLSLNYCWQSLGSHEACGCKSVEKRLCNVSL